MGESKLSSFLTIFFSISINFFLLAFLVGAPWPNIFSSRDPEGLQFNKLPKTAQTVEAPRPIALTVEKNIAHFSPAPAHKHARVIEAKVEQQTPEPETLVPVQDKFAGVQSKDDDEVTEATAVEANPASPVPAESTVLDPESESN